MMQIQTLLFLLHSVGISYGLVSFSHSCAKSMRNGQHKQQQRRIGNSVSVTRQPSLIQIQAQQEATFGMGCFWKPSEELLKEDGVVNTIVGYTGVSDAKTPPTYDTVCFSRDWVEGVRVIYDDEKVSYSQLLNAFFQAQEPKVGSRQYASIIFPHNDEQEQLARQWLEDNQTLLRNDGLPITLTTIEEQYPFYRAENYHQEYWQKTRPRISGAIALMAVATGFFDGIIPQLYQSQIHSVANAIVLVGLVYVSAERFFDRKVVLL